MGDDVGMSNTLADATTLPALARDLNLSLRKVEYAATSRGIEPDIRVRHWRLYGVVKQARIRAALTETGALPAEPAAAEATR